VAAAGVDETQTGVFPRALVVQQEALAVASVQEQAAEDVDVAPLALPRLDALGTLRLGGGSQQKLLVADDPREEACNRRPGRLASFHRLELPQRAAIGEDVDDVAARPVP